MKTNILLGLLIQLNIFSVFINLTHLIFSESSYENIVTLFFYVPFRSFSSSSLLVLDIKIQSFSQLVYVLDGRFSQLHTLVVELANIVYFRELVERNKVSYKDEYIIFCFVLLGKNPESKMFCSIVCLGTIML
jgi:hypothetical protein